MAKKRILKRDDEEGSTKRASMRSPNPERSVLNDGLLNLYKKELDCQKEKASSSQDESNTENKSKENSIETSKTPSKSGKRSKIAALTPKQSTVNFDNIGGLDKVLKEIGIPIIEVSATELVRGISGESESMIRDIFSAALATGRCILFIDEIDAICGKRETNENAMLKRMVTQMIKSFDELSQKDPEGNIVVIGATNMPDSLDNALRRGSRFTHEIAIGMPDEEGRLSILKAICKKNLCSDEDFHWVAHHTPGYVGADLKTLVSTARMKALDRVDSSLPSDQNSENVEDFEELLDAQPLSEVRKWFQKYNNSEEEIVLTLRDFKAALKECVPSSKREGFAFVPDTTWDEIGSYDDIKKELQRSIMWAVEDHKFFDRNKVSSSRGILLYGPKGCGKTLLAKAVANQCSINFIAVNGPELLNMYVGESEKAVRKCFERARNSAPCIIFFDEFDALCPPRSSSKENVAIERVVNQLLIESAGISGRKQVFLMAATNRLDKIDSAMLRPGRFDKVLYVGLPSPAARIEILKSLIKGRTLEEGLELEKIALDPRCENFSGADLANLIEEAGLKAVGEMRNSGQKREGVLVLSMRHFDEAFAEIKPSISEQERRYYEKLSAGHSKHN
ncbi:Nuclear valosin-containing protein-like [Argiope bruennichi]|uniref:Nuclear valosin-containing protein-like n=1 Tax=Argiope bruennichi TaxID=94029 RepID=A0A8T0FP92_ARGBR|nr:Nuclear valosin-containing protein-like [Argiope bruennichi]